MENNYFINLEDKDLINELIVINKELLESTKEFSIKSSVLWLYKIRNVVDSEDFGFSELKEFIVNICEKLENIIFAEGTNLRKFAEIKAIRQELFETLELVEAYDIYALDVLEILDYYGIKAFSNENYKEIPPGARDIQILKEKIRLTLDGLTKTPEKYFQFVRDIIHELPMSLTTNKTVDVVRNSLLRTAQGKPEYFIQREFDVLKDIVNYRQAEGYGTKFAEIFELITKVKGENIESKNSDDIKILMSIIRNIISRIRFYSSRLRELGITCNQMITHYLIDDFNLDSETKSLFAKYKESTGEEKESMLKRLEKNLIEDAKYQSNKISSLNKVSTTLVRRENVDLSPVKDILESSKFKLMYYNDSFFLSEEDLLKETIYPISDIALNMKIDELSEVISERLNSLDSLERKISLRRLLSKLQVPFYDIEEFMKYIEDSLTDRSISGKLIPTNIFIL